MTALTRDTHLLLAGTKKGVFIGRAAAGARGPGAWRFSGPHCSGTWSFFDVRYDPATGVIYAGGQSNWYGAAVWRSPDLGQTWTHSSEGLAFPDGPVIEQVWRIQPCGRTVFAGVDPAGLFRSDDGGQTWQEVDSLRRHPTSAAWSPTNGGLPLHAILPKAGDTSGLRLWVALSAGGIYGTDDGGRTWAQAPAAESACVHALVQTTDGTVYQQNHAGIWRSDETGGAGPGGESGGVGLGGESKGFWTDVSAGLPSRFGFPLATHPREPGTLYAVPLESGAAGARHVPDDGVAVWRTRDAGASWQSLTEGLPQGPTYMTVLRGALAVDQLDPAGVFFGSPTGLLFGSADEGDTWFDVARGLPPIFSVSCAVI